jgi:hypothetical protein
MSANIAADNASDGFKHQVAIKLSRALNIINPNDLLAERVIDIAKTNSADGFAKGQFHCVRSHVYLLTTCYSSPGLWQVSRFLSD